MGAGEAFFTQGTLLVRPSPEHAQLSGETLFTIIEVCLSAVGIRLEWLSENTRISIISSSFSGSESSSSHKGYKMGTSASWLLRCPDVTTLGPAAFCSMDLLDLPLICRPLDCGLLPWRCSHQSAVTLCCLCMELLSRNRRDYLLWPIEFSVRFHPQM